MKRIIPARLPVVIGALALGLAAWIVVGGVVLVDSIRVVRTPTLIAATATDSSQTIIITATLLPSPVETEIPVVPTLNTPITPTLVNPTAVPTGGSAQVAITPQAATQLSGCSIPAGWVVYTVESGDTLFGFALGSNGKITVADIMTGNCLGNNKLLSVGQTIFLPPGVAEQSPKIDDSPPEAANSSAGSLPAGLSRTAKCPCTVTVRVGWRLEQIAAAVDAAPVGFTGADFLRTVAAGAPAPSLGFLQSRPARKSLAGFMNPGSYNLDNSTSAGQFRDMLLGACGGAVSAQVQADATAQNLTFWEAVNLASIIQRESYTPSEQKLLASVFHNRLAANKRLAATVTLQYGLGQPGNWWPRITSVSSQSPYNTSNRTGLQPSPLESPTLSAILAAIYPAQTNYLYFSAKCGGGAKF